MNVVMVLSIEIPIATAAMVIVIKSNGIEKYLIYP
jgi:hypothetical protein